MKDQTEIRDRYDGCMTELDAHLHPQAYNPERAAVLQGWMFALAWVLEDDDPYDRSDEIMEELDDQ